MKHELLFFHGNGLPKSTYHEFLNALSIHYHGPERFNDFAQIAQAKSWRPILNEAKIAIEKSSADIIMGHSMCGILSMWSISELRHLSPKTIIVLDPVLFSAPMNYLIEITSRLNLLGHIIPEPKIAIKRRASFKDKQSALDHFKTKNVFKKFTDKSLQNYIDSFIENEYGLHLPITPSEEALVFKHMPGLPFFTLPRQHRYLWLYSGQDDFV
jgi:hypothetical protein